MTQEPEKPEEGAKKKSRKITKPRFIQRFGQPPRCAGCR